MKDWLVINYRNDIDNREEFNHLFMKKYPQWKNDIKIANFVGEKDGRYIESPTPWTDNRISYKEAIEILKKH